MEYQYLSEMDKAVRLKLRGTNQKGTDMKKIYIPHHVDKKDLDLKPHRTKQKERHAYKLSLFHKEIFWI